MKHYLAAALYLVWCVLMLRETFTHYDMYADFDIAWLSLGVAALFGERAYSHLTRGRAN